MAVEDDQASMRRVAYESGDRVALGCLLGYALAACGNTRETECEFSKFGH